MLQRFFAHTEETDAQLKTLADGTYTLMAQALRPLGDIVTRLPAGPQYPGQTAGPSFELFYESDYVLPHREAAWVLMAERIEQAAAFCAPPGAGTTPAVTARLAEVRGTLAGIARSLAAHVPSRPAPLTAEPGDELPAVLERALSLYRTCARFSSTDALSSALADVARAAYVVVKHACRSEETRTEAAAAARVADSVLRPLADRLGRDTAAGAPSGPEPALLDETMPDGPDATVAELARRAAADATGLRARLADAAPPELLEAVAALQRVAVDLAPDGAAQAAELAELIRGLRPQIVVARDGPYLVTNAAAVRSYLGEPLPVPPQLALCRCGESADKPFCDGSHARTGFSGGKDPKRVPDRRDTYPGAQVTILDNRGICQHSGFCTDRLPTVFRTDAEPFVAPSGGRMDEIVRAVRDCPSGALSLAFDGTQARDLAEWHGQRQPAVEVSLDGPYRVTGGIALADAAGAEVPLAGGASREHYALCRCGHSRNKPFCSGMHWYVQFRDPPRPADPTLFAWAGGLPALTRMTRMLYEKLVPADDLLAAAFADLPAGAAEREAAWVAEAFGGPAHDGATALAGRDLGPRQRARWVALAVQAADQARLPDDPSFRASLTGFLEWASRGPAGAAADVPRWDWGPGGPPAESVEPADVAQPDVTLPGPRERVGFEAHIRPLFRERDRASMRFAFDLWSRDDVQRHAADILQRLRDGTMPCDVVWPPTWTEVFARWAESGFEA
jgi:CDGSH-type Zn-finger protein